MIRIIVADDHTLVRGGIISLLAPHKDIEIAGETGSGAEAVRLCRELSPDVVLLDLNIPDMDGLEATKRIVESRSDTKVLILTMHENEEYAARVLRAGASGFIVKGISPEELPDAIRQVNDGEVYVTESIMKKLVVKQSKGLSGDSDKILSLLSDRELQVFTDIARGKTLNEIGESLNVSPSTIGTYKSRVMEKLNLKSNADVLRLALHLGLVEKYD